MGQVGITCELSTMLSYVAMQIEVELQKLYHLFAYLKLHHKSTIVHDPNYPEIHGSDF